MISEQSLKDLLRVISQEKTFVSMLDGDKFFSKDFSYVLVLQDIRKKFTFKGGNLLAYLMQVGHNAST
jgi:hypothetical protein